MNLFEQMDGRPSEGYENTFEGVLDLLLQELKNKEGKGRLPSSKKIGGLITAQMDVARLNTGMWAIQKDLIENFFNTLDDKYGNKLPVQNRIKNKVYRALGLNVVIDSHPSSKTRDQIEADLNVFISGLTEEHGFRKKIADILLFVMEEKFGFNSTSDYGISESGTEILNSEVNMLEFSDELLENFLQSVDSIEQLFEAFNHVPEGQMIKVFGCSRYVMKERINKVVAKNDYARQVPVYQEVMVDIESITEVLELRRKVEELMHKKITDF